VHKAHLPTATWLRCGADSREQMTTDDPIHKPMIGRSVLGLLRSHASHHVRLLKERMARSMLQYRGAGRDDADFVLRGRAAVGKSA
jgi:hypothetical protein